MRHNRHATTPGTISALSAVLCLAGCSLQSTTKNKCSRPGDCLDGYSCHQGLCVADSTDGSAVDSSGVDSSAADLDAGGGEQIENCGGATCVPGQRCCGPVHCGFCIPQWFEVTCPASCPTDGGVDAHHGSDGAVDGGVHCGGETCNDDQRCCGPADCGQCVPKWSKIGCPVACPDAGPDAA